jgi:hypothetical protein
VRPSLGSDDVVDDDARVVAVQGRNQILQDLDALIVGPVA